MGSRGASSGISIKGKIYGTEYTTLLQHDNIKFVRYNQSLNTSNSSYGDNGTRANL
ncbi:MAG: hypothetical protein IJQ99_03820 [Synergistaceae bacterium]|nr:hypothetical protein [Synergistaceae bacterium]